MGSGGNMLNRILCLSEKTIPLVKHEDVYVDQVTQMLSKQQRFDLYNFFDVTDWRTSEYSVILQYKWGFNDFYKYEQSEQFLIDNWHPHVFEQEVNRGVLWGDNFWEHVIFIDCDQDDKAFINAQTTKKDYPPNSQEMFDCYDRLIEQYRDLSIVLSFKTILDKTKFQTWLTDISQQLELDLDIELSMKLWNNWHEHSQQCWTSTPLINRKNVYGQTWDKKITKN